MIDNLKHDEGIKMGLFGFGKKADKHSTGGVGDKTTLIVAPLAAAMGLKVAKMSGRGLGHTGGTVDKLESIPGYKTELSREEFFSITEKCGFTIIPVTCQRIHSESFPEFGKYFILTGQELLEIHENCSRLSRYVPSSDTYSEAF